MATYRSETMWVMGAFVAGFLLIIALLLSNMSVYILGPIALLGVLSILVIATLWGLARWALRGRGEAESRRAVPSVQEAMSTPVVVRTTTTEGLPASLGGVDIFRDLSPEQLLVVASLGEMVMLPAGLVLAKRGESGSALYALLEGHVEFTAGVGEPEITLRVAGPGEALPLASVLGEGRLVTTAQAITDIRAFRFPRQRFTELCIMRPDIGARIYRSIAEIALERYGKTVARLTDTVAYALDQVDFWANV